MKKPSIPNHIKQKIRKTETLIRKTLDSSTVIKDASMSVLLSGGKRLRPLMLILSGYSNACLNGDNIIKAAAAVELLHMGSLVHDDIVDETKQRRGSMTVHTKWNEAVAISTGDNLFAKAFQIISGIGNQAATELLVYAVNEMSRGQLDEITYKKTDDYHIDEYLDLIFRKTAVLFEVSSGIGGLLNESASEEVTENLKSYGANLGMAFQIVDDLLDLASTEKELGKPSGNDLRQRTRTLPVLIALDKGLSKEDLKNVGPFSSDDEISRLIEKIRNTGALEQTAALVGKYTQNAIEAINKTDCFMKKYMIEIAEYLRFRVY